MEMLIIEGGRPLQGDVSISGSKNAALPILIATLLTEKTSVLKNVPNLADTRFLGDLLTSFGAQYRVENNQATIDCEKITNVTAHYDVVRKMRASVLVLAPLLARHGEAVVSLPGGCAIGTRPVDIHLQGLRKLGAEIDVIDGYIHAKLKNGYFCGADFELELPSVGATENLVMAAVLARGDTTLRRVAKEPEVIELCAALNAAGAKIKGAGTSVLEIEGVHALRGIQHEIKPDRIEAGSFIALAAITGSTIKLTNVCMDDLRNVTERFEQAGVTFVMSGDSNGIGELQVVAPPRLMATDIETAGYPGFPTDMQAQFMAAMTVAKGSSTIYERVFENRMMHVPELRRMGAKIDVRSGGIAKVEGCDLLRGAPVMATDLRASASLVIAALAALGRSEIRRVYHLDRGYEAIEKKLLGLGANITRCKQTA